MTSLLGLFFRVLLLSFLVLILILVLLSTLSDELSGD
jgi:hypothetical protein